jgi:branched-chain amino acid transport system substrate-binding protein
MANVARWCSVTMLALVLSGCTGGQSKEPINLAYLFPQTGPDREQGRQAQQAVLLAVEETNQDDKGVLGRSLAVHNFDTRGDLETANGETVRVLSLQRIAAVIAGPDAAIAEQVVRTAHPYPTTVIVPGELPETQTGDGAIALGVDPRLRGQLLARYASQELKAKRAVVLTDKRNLGDRPAEKTPTEQPPRADNRNSVGHRVANGFFDDWPRAVPASAEEWPIVDFATQKDLAQRLADAKPDVVLVCSSASHFLRLWSQCQEAKVAAPLLFGGEDLGVRPLQGSSVGPDTYVATIYTPDALTDKGKAFAKKYEERFHEPPDLASVQAYDAVRLAAETIQRQGLTSPDDLRKEFGKIEKFESLLGPVVWKDHTARRRAFVVRIRDKNVEGVTTVTKEVTVVKAVNPDD